MRTDWTAVEAQLVSERSEYARVRVKNCAEWSVRVEIVANVGATSQGAVWASVMGSVRSNA